ncbi:MAG: hypothetical protein NTY96_10700 [Bacteroidetes bacterium]|nr:hypothetical protein [Bacteroidota bacterium]
MRTNNKSILSAAVIFILILTALISSPALAQKKSPALKIGTYDSRTVIFAWSRTDLLKQHMMKWKQQNDSAQKSHDTARIKELAVEAMSFQHLLHLMVFSNGSVSSFMEIIKVKLPGLAKTAGVSVIVSKWELNYSDPSFEVIDLTNQVAALFQPKENIDKMASEIAKQAPVPIDEMGIETDMLDGYCKMFGKK